MARKRINHAAHIKPRTQGSSNEISFSVLDAVSEARSGKDREGGAGLGEGVPLFTLGRGKKPRSTPEKDHHIVPPKGEGLPKRPAAPARTVSMPAERSVFRFVPVLVGVCVIVALALTVGQTFLQMREYQGTLRGGLDGEIARITDADNTLIPFDALVMEQYDDDHFSRTAEDATSNLLDTLSSRYREVVADIAPAQEEMQSAIAAIEQLQPSLTDNDAIEAAHQAITAARSRLNMLNSGIAIIDEALMATEAYEACRDGWKNVLDADAAARAATDYLAEMTEDNVRASMAQTQEALSLLEDATDEFVQAQNAYPGLDIQAYIDYTEKRAEAQRAALASDQAYLDRNKELLESENVRYNELEAEAADLAQNLTDEPQLAVTAKYDGAIAKNVESYESERLKAGNADTFIRDYLGNRD